MNRTSVGGMRWALFAGWVVALGYYTVRVTLLAVPDHCPDKIWHDGPPECDWTSFDVAWLMALPVLAVATVVFGLVAVIRTLRGGRSVSH